MGQTTPKIMIAFFFVELFFAAGAPCQAWQTLTRKEVE
jgi:hypothetical protein